MNGGDHLMMAMVKYVGAFENLMHDIVVLGIKIQNPQKIIPFSVFPFSSKS